MANLSYFAAPGISGLTLFRRKIDIVNKIINTVCGVTDVNKELLFKRTRRREIVEARQICIFLIKENVHWSLKTIGNYFGGRDHTTALHSINTVKNLSFSDRIYKDRLCLIQSKL